MTWEGSVPEVASHTSHVSTQGQWPCGQEKVSYFFVVVASLLFGLIRKWMMLGVWSRWGKGQLQIQKPRLAWSRAAAPFPLGAEPSLDLATNPSRLATHQLHPRRSTEV